MIPKLYLFIVVLFATSPLSSANVLNCVFEIINDTCTCTFIIFNPSGALETITSGNPIQNCGFNDVEKAVGFGNTANVPITICQIFPMLKTLEMKNLDISNLDGNPFNKCNNLTSLDLSSNKISEITALTFANTKLETLIFDMNLIRNVESTTFMRIETLKRLSFMGNFGIQFPDDVFDPLTNLNYLLLSFCNINQISARWLRELKSLTVLDLSNNALTSIDAQQFQQSPNLQHVDLSRNQLTSLNEATFRNNTELLTLNLYFNQLRSLPPNLFENNGKLVSLVLSNNDFPNITESLLEPLVLLKVLDLRRNSITTLQPSWFKTLRSLISLNLSDNLISDIDELTFSATNILETIDLSNNRIATLNSRSFGFLHALYNLNLADNEMTGIDHHFMNQSNILSTVNINGNECAAFETNTFNANKSFYMDKMTECFDAFDAIEIKLTTSHSLLFDWYNIRTKHGWEALEVTVKAHESAHIALADVFGNPLIQVQLGEEHNRQSNIVERGEIVFADRVFYRIDPNEERTFVISWKFGILLVFIKGEQLPFMGHTIRDPFPVNFFGLRTLINPQLSPNIGVWNVKRIRGNVPLAMSTLYENIGAKIYLGMPINLNDYLLR